MVAPYQIGDPARSFIRVPGSGAEGNAKPICYDLSRGAPVAAANPVRSTSIVASLSASASQSDSSNGAKPSGQDSGNGAKNCAQGKATSETDKEMTAASHGRHQTLAEGGSSPAIKIPDNGRSGTSKRPHPCETDDPEEGNSSTKSRNKIARLSVEENGTEFVQNRSDDRNSDLPVQSNESSPHLLATSQEATSQQIFQLIVERNQLRQQNRVLQSQVEQFRDIFKSKDRLTSLLRRLNIPVNIEVQ